MSETSFYMHDVHVDNGIEWYNVVLQTSFDKLPSVLIPGETVTLYAFFYHSGTVKYGVPAVTFRYSGEGGVLIEPFRFIYSPWHQDFNGIDNAIFSFVVPVPDTHGSLINIYVDWRNQYACEVLWGYIAEESTTTVSSSTTTTVPDTSTTTTTMPGSSTTTTCDPYNEFECGDKCCKLVLEKCCFNSFCCNEDQECCGIGFDLCCNKDKKCCDYVCCYPDQECCGKKCCNSGEVCDDEDSDINDWECDIEACTILGIYGEDSEEVELLRDFRDNVLSKSPVGQEIIRLYYQWSPAIVKAMEEDEEFNEEVKEMIDGFLPLIGKTE